MSDSEAVVEKRRGRPAKDKSEVIIHCSFNVHQKPDECSLLFMFCSNIYDCPQDVKESKKRARETEKKDKDVVKKDDEVPAKRGRGRPPKSGASAGKKSSDKPKV